MLEIDVLTFQRTLQGVIFILLLCYVTSLNCKIHSICFLRKMKKVKLLIGYSFSRVGDQAIYILK